MLTIKRIQYGGYAGWRRVLLDTEPTWRSVTVLEIQRRIDSQEWLLPAEVKLEPFQKEL